ncbi:MAG: YdcF family protein [Anaerolineaceae bacterium]|nr:YdcF family protein [Anaerolineaceae bacterium]
MIRFDTRDKKPKVYSIAILTALTAALILILHIGNRDANLKWINLVLALYFAADVLILFQAFIKQLEYNPYSYNTIIYSGFGLFLLIQVFTYICLAVSCFRDPIEFGRDDMLYSLLNSGKNFLRLSIPALVIFSAGLFVSNIKLILIDGRKFRNYLAMILAVLIVAGLAGIFLLNRYVAAANSKNLIRNLLLNLAAAVYLYFECMMIGTVIADVIAAKYHADPDKDVLIIPGAGLEKDGTPTPVLQNRLDLAANFCKEQLEKTGKTAVFIVSGGQGPDEIQSEAAAMKTWLTDRGVPEEQILMEDRSTNTYENMLYSKEIVSRISPDAKIAFFTSDFHVFRAGLKARQVKMRAVGMGSPTRWYFWPSASVREFFGLLMEHRVKQSCVLFGLTAIYALLTILVFR